MVFGKASGFASVINLSTLTGSNGFRLDGVAADDLSGWSVASAGDVNGDGFADLIVGAYDASAGVRLYAGSSYVVFGKASGFASATNLSTLTGSNGFRLDGVTSGNQSGYSVAGAGDVNGDGFADLIVGALAASPGFETNAGSSYVVFGKGQWSASPSTISVNESAGTANITVSRKNSGVQQTVYISTTQNHGSTNNGDYVGINSQPFTFLVGEKSKTVPVTILNDSIGEPDETYGFIVQKRATDLPSVTLADSTFTIADDDFSSIDTWSVSPIAASVHEAAKKVQFTISRSTAVSSQTVYVSTTQDQGFTNHNDYVGFADQAITFNPDETSKPVTVTIANDAVPELDEKFGLLVQSLPVSVTKNVLAKSVFTILNDDAGSTYSLNATILGRGALTFSGGQSCSSTCSIDFPTGQRVTISQNAASYNHFAGWTGACSGLLDCTVQMSQAQSVTAKFVADGISSLEIIDPFLMPSFKTSPDNLLIGTFLKSAKSIQDAAIAAGIALDDTADAIVIYHATTADPVNFSTHSAILSAYSDSFLTEGPSSGADAIDVTPSGAYTNDGNLYAIALIRPSSIIAFLGNTVTVTASQAGKPPVSGSVHVVPPPVVLVHGIWSGPETWDYLADYLTTKAVFPIPFVYRSAYESFRPFNDFKVWGNLAIDVSSAIYSMDQARIVDSKVDIVAHSMGGLVARYFATQNGSNGKLSYTSYHDRNRGKYHLIISLDTPENGSRLATYLTDRAARKPTGLLDIPSLFSLCGSFSVSVAECFRALDRPMAPDDGNISAGAIYALRADSPVLKTLNDNFDPNIPNTQWFAFAGKKDFLSNLSKLLALTSLALGEPTTVDAILGSSANDAVVTLDSEKFRAHAGHVIAFESTQHSGGLIPPYYDSIVTESSMVAQAVDCLLSSDGVANCSLLASGSRTAGVRPIRAVRRIVHGGILAAGGGPIAAGRLIELQVNIGLRDATDLQLTESDAWGNVHVCKEARIETKAGSAVLRFVPKLFGKVEYKLSVMDRGGILGVEQTTRLVGAPDGRLLEIRADENFRSVVLESIGASYTLRPRGLFAFRDDVNDIPLSGHVTYHIVPKPGVAIIAVSEGGVVTAQHDGTATVEVKYSGSVARVEFVVRSGT